jgi:hypothetical protein
LKAFQPFPLSKEAHVKLTLSKVCRTSVAAAGVMVAASAAFAESRPLGLETEFDLGHVGGALSLDTTAAVQAAAIDVSTSIGNWQDSIGSYLDGLLSSDRTPGVEGAATEVKDEPKPGADVDEDDLIEEEVAAFKPAESVKAEPKVEANPLLLAPVLSHPMNCPECLKLAEQAAADAQSEEIEESRVDDAAALQSLADWAGARVADDVAAAATDDDVATAESAFFDDAIDETLTN